MDLNKVALSYGNGLGIEKGYILQNNIMLSTLAGNVFTICNTDYCYNCGIGMSCKDKKEVFEWYLKAAGKGYSLTQYIKECVLQREG
ncbi:hypothetical protein Glove_37g133 [Diversispora epigaea]|uniref:Sel1 repeat family protein n=1 Tax=Diversispora epigaea TaxID=1348612 RepID=A0A397JG89_9GLOM|nr:hypothetical protein Glove_37g133 [Diversispora epigaea]